MTIQRGVTVAAFVALVVAIGVGAAAVTADRSGTRTPDDNSPAAGFARDMSVHHAQAVEMAEIIRDRARDDGMRFLAKDLALTQQAQIGQMGAWLDLWGLERTSFVHRPMDWSGMQMHGRMPGFATNADIARLSALPVDQAETAFLHLMIAHHRGGIHMARAVLARHPPDVVARLARQIVASQTAEIAAMRDMLRARRVGTG